MPTTAYSPFLYVPGTPLSRAELNAAALDGDVTEVGAAFMPADAIETAALRAASLGNLVPDTVALVRKSAAWVYGAVCSEPPTHSVQRITPKRIAPVRANRLSYLDQLLAPEGFHLLAGVAVSTPVRTLIDVARCTRPEREGEAALLVRGDPQLLAATLRWLAQSGRFPGKRAAAAFLLGLQEEVTR